jgi:gamma-glutamylcyclotransferase (GGCT)/AIG2-like uncharacterized protein YtfP
MKIFVYGTLIDLAAFGRCAGRPVKRGAEPAVLHGFTRVKLRQASYPTLRRAPGCQVEGLVVRVTADMLLRLCNYESVRYRVVHVRLVSQSGPHRARVFIGDAPTKVAWVPDEKIMTLRSRTF